jgi:5'-deoxynucleotidase YfbR-like HD superfamily hydrolase
MVRVDAFKRDDANLQDIATSLSRLARFNGHTRDFYSVAQHSVIVALVAADLANPTGCADQAGVALRAARWGLFHDAHETWLGDVAGPLKPLTEKLNDHAFYIDKVVRQAFGLPEYTDTDVAVLVNEADRQVLAREATDLLRHDTGWAKGLKRWDGGHIATKQEPREAERCFLDLYEALFGTCARLTEMLAPESLPELWRTAGVSMVKQVTEGQA